MKASTLFVLPTPVLALFLFGFALALPLRAKTVLFGDSNHPVDSVYLAGERVELTFRIGGLEPKKPGPDLTLRWVDEYGRELKRASYPILADAGGMDEVVVRDAPCGKLGFYRVFAALADGTKLTTPWSSRRDGEMTYAVVRDPNERELVDEEELMFFGNFDERLGGRLPESHAQDGLVGQPVSGQWRRIDRYGPGTYADNPENAKVPLDRHIMFLSGSCDHWTKADLSRCFRMENHVDAGRPAALTPEGEREFERMLRAYVPNYRRQFADRKPRLYEVSSEWGAAENGSRTEADIIRCYEIASRVIRELDPEGLVCGVGWAIYRERQRTHNFLKAGIGKYLDAVSTHAYFNPDPVEPNGLVEQIRDAKAMVREYCGRDLPVYNTEFGMATYDKAPLEPVQMKHLVRSSAIFAGEGWKSISLFIRVDFRLQPGFGYFYNLSYGRDFKKFGGDFETPKTSPKPVYPAMSALCWFLANQRPVGDIPYLGPTVWGYAFRHAKKGTVNLAVWNWGGGTERVTVPVGRREVRVADHMGNLRTAACDAKGNLALDLGDMPIYVFDVDSAIWEAPDGDRAVRAKRYCDEQAKARRAAGVKIASVLPALAKDGSPAVEVAVENLTGASVEATVTVRVRDAVGASSRLGGILAAPPNGNATTRFLLPLARPAGDPLRREPVTVTVALKDGRVFEETRALNFLYVPRFAGDWTKVTARRLDPRRNCVQWPENFGGADDFDGTLQMAYDDAGLLVRLDVADDRFVKPGEKGEIVRGDGVQIALAKSVGYTATGNTLQDQLIEARTLYSFGLDGDDRRIWRHASYDRETPHPLHPIGAVEAGTDGYGLTGGVTKTARGVRAVYEIRLPWHAINAGKPQPGDRHAFGLAVFDRDDKPGGKFSAYGAFDLTLADKFGVFVLGPVDADFSSASTLKFSGVLGQSAETGAAPVPFSAALAVGTGPDGRVWMIDDARQLRSLDGDRFSQPVLKSPTNVPVLQEDGRDLWILGDGGIWRADLEKGRAESVKLAVKIRSAAVAPEKGPLLARGKFFAVDAARNVIVALDRTGALCGDFAPVPILEKRASVRSMAVLPETGQLVVVTSFPDCRIYRFNADGTRDDTGGWPINLGQGDVFVADGRLHYAESRALTEIGRHYAGRRVAKRIPIDEDHTIRGYAVDRRTGCRYLASQQGVKFARRGENAFRHRLGGLTDLIALAIDGGTVLFASGGYSKMRHLYLNDEPDRPFASTEDGRNVYNWTSRFGGIVPWGGRYLCALDRVGPAVMAYWPEWINTRGRRRWIDFAFDPPLEKNAGCTALCGDYFSREILFAVKGGVRRARYPIAGEKKIPLAHEPVAALAGRDIRFLARADGSAFVGFAEAASFGVLSSETGKILWEKQSEGPVAGLAAARGELFVSDGKGLRFFSSETGAPTGALDPSAVPGGYTAGLVAASEDALVLEDRKGLRLLRFTAKTRRVGRDSK